MNDRSPGWGLGIEVGASTLRVAAVRLDRPDDRIAAEFAADRDDDTAIVDALVRASGIVEIPHPDAIPLHLAVADDHLLVQTVDVTGRRRDDVVALGDRAARSGTADASVVVEDGRRRRVGLVRGVTGRARRLTDLAVLAGFARIRVEPAPFALGRVLPSGRFLVRRTADDDLTWLALFDDGFPVAAASTPGGPVAWPSLRSIAAGGRHDDPDEVFAADRLGAYLDALATRRLARHRLDRTDTDGWPLDPPALGPPRSTQPSFPRHDPRSTEHIAVAIGAACGAAGATERHRRLLELAPLAPVAARTDAPWAIEPVDLAPGRDEPAVTAPSPPRRGARHRDTDRAAPITRRYRRRR